MANNNKQRSGFWSYLLWLVLMSIALVSAARGEDRALLIGVGRYAHFDDRLNGVSLDLDMMNETAQMMGFHKNAIKILEHEQATTANVYSIFDDWLVKAIKPEDRVLIYFSGHGSQVPDENGDELDHFDEVLLLYDTTLIVKDGRQTLNGVLHDDRFGKMLAQINSRNILVILDACHSGSATRSIRLAPRTFPVNDAQVKYFYYSPMLENAGGSGRFDLTMPGNSPDVTDRYVAITACRDNENTLATSRGSIFTLGLSRAVRSAAMAGNSLTPEKLQRQTTRFIRELVRSEGIVFHPQIAGYKNLRQRPLQLMALSGSRGQIRPKLAVLAPKSPATMRIKPNKTCFEPGDALEISVKITEPGYLNVMSTTADDRSTVLFPNQYHPQNAVDAGDLTIPTDQMNFELVSEGPPGPHLITAILSRWPANASEAGNQTKYEVMAELSPISTGSMNKGQKMGYLAAGKITVEVRETGGCK